MNSAVKKENRLPRAVWVAAIGLKGLWPESTVAGRMKNVLERMENVYAFEPDLICLPETVNLSWVEESKSLEEIAEEEMDGGPVTHMLSAVARRQHCYITCPVITKKDGLFYNSSILLNRQGQVAGVFHKIHPTSAEVIAETYYRGGGVTPGSASPVACKTDFGTIGMQICADADWEDGWRSLKKEGAEIVCFSSQGPYSQTLSDRAWMNKYYIASATGEDARIIDMTGDVIASDGEFARWVCVGVNLEKAFIHIWPHALKFDAIRKKYGRKVRLKIYHPENWATLECLDPVLKAADILAEYEIPSYEEQIAEATAIQDKYRV